MAAAKRAKVTEKDVVGLKYFDKLKPLLARLHDCGCGRDKAGNRTLHFDQCGSYFVHAHVQDAGLRYAKEHLHGSIGYVHGEDGALGLPGRFNTEVQKSPRPRM